MPMNMPLIYYSIYKLQYLNLISQYYTAAVPLLFHRPSRHFQPFSVATRSRHQSLFPQRPTQLGSKVWFTVSRRWWRQPWPCITTACWSLTASWRLTSSHMHIILITRTCWSSMHIRWRHTSRRCRISAKGGGRRQRELLIGVECSQGVRRCCHWSRSKIGPSRVARK